MTDMALASSIADQQSDSYTNDDANINVHKDFETHMENAKKTKSKRSMSFYADASHLLAQKMMQGWTLTAEHCPTENCHTPLMRSRENVMLCVNCNCEITPKGAFKHVGNGNQHTDAINAADRSMSKPQISRQNSLNVSDRTPESTSPTAGSDSVSSTASSSAGRTPQNAPNPAENGHINYGDHDFSATSAQIYSEYARNSNFSSKNRMSAETGSLASLSRSRPPPLPPSLIRRYGSTIESNSTTPPPTPSALQLPTVSSRQNSYDSMQSPSSAAPSNMLLVPPNTPMPDDLKRQSSAQTNVRSLPQGHDVAPNIILSSYVPSQYRSQHEKQIPLSNNSDGPPSGIATDSNKHVTNIEFDTILSSSLDALVARLDWCSQQLTSTTSLADTGLLADTITQLATAIKSIQRCQ